MREFKQVLTVHNKVGIPSSFHPFFHGSRGTYLGSSEYINRSTRVGKSFAHESLCFVSRYVKLLVKC